MLMLVVLLTVMACKKPSFSVIPKINFIQMDKQKIQAGSDTGEVNITFFVEDGDGDIGANSGNFIFKDSRDNSETSFTVPTIPEEYAPEKGIRANIVVAYRAAWLNLREDTTHLHLDTLQWQVFLVDKTGNKSNVVATDTLILMK